MRKFILWIGILSLVLGLAPYTLAKHEPVSKELRIHSVVHLKCNIECVVVNKEI